MVKVTRRRSRKWTATCSCGWIEKDLSYFDASQAANTHRLMGMNKKPMERHLTVISRTAGPGA